MFLLHHRRFARHARGARLFDHDARAGQQIAGKIGVARGMAGQLKRLTKVQGRFELSVYGFTVDALNQFTGSNRRFEFKGKIGGITVIDDYAHHPTEIRATLQAAANYTHETLWCVFQPHTYTRTNAFLKEFADALSMADKVILADIYAAREINTLGITSKDLQKLLLESGKECYYFPTFDEIENFLLEHCINGDLLITMGAGDIVKVGESILGL